MPIIGNTHNSNTVGSNQGIGRAGTMHQVIARSTA